MKQCMATNVSFTMLSMISGRGIGRDMIRRIQAAPWHPEPRGPKEAPMGLNYDILVPIVVASRNREFICAWCNEPGWSLPGSRQNMHLVCREEARLAKLRERTARQKEKRHGRDATHAARAE